MTNTEIGTVRERTYHSPSTFRCVFFTGDCPSCRLVFNSGHHYLPNERHFIEQIVDEHNAKVHGVR